MKPQIIDPAVEEFCQIVARILVEIAKNASAPDSSKPKKTARRPRRR